MPVETRTHTSSSTTYGVPVVDTRLTAQLANQPVMQSHTEYKVEDDRSFGEKAKDAIKDAAHTVKEAFTPNVTDKDIAKAELKHQELLQKEEMDRRRAENAASQKNQLQSHAEHLQDKQFVHREQELHHAQKADEQAQKVNHLQNKQAQQQANKCTHAVRCQGACPVTGEVASACPVTGAVPTTGEVKVTRTTKIH